MASSNEPARPSDEVEVQPSAYGRTSDDPILDGLYFLRNKMARTVLDLGEPESGTPCKGWSQHNHSGIGNQIWIVQKSVAGDTYTLRNIRHATVLDLLEGNPQNGASIIGCNRVEGSLNQEWRIAEHALHHHTLQCARTNTYLEIAGGSAEDGTKVTCSEGGSGSKDHQLWILDRVSRSSLEVGAIIGQWKPELQSRLFLPHGDAAEYLCLPGNLCRNLWEQTNLRRQLLRPHLFDHDLFVIRTKDGVHSWARDCFPKVQGFGVLFGIIYGHSEAGPKVYNWCLTSDMCLLVFFDPQTGKEYSTAALDQFGFEPVFATF